MKRRGFFHLTAAGITAAALPAWVYPRTPEYSSISANPGKLSLIWDKETISSVGNAYLKDNPAEDNDRSLVRLLTGNISSEADKIPELLQEQIIQDFKQGKIVVVEGWVLSVTEARQCALFSILYNR